MAEKKKNKLQVKIGGALSGPQAAALIAAGRQALTALEPKVRAVILAHYERLAMIVAADKIDTQAFYDLAHDVRGLAGTFGYISLGQIADGVARYLTACTESGTIAHQGALQVLAQAMEQAFVKDADGGETLSDLTAGALALVRAKMPSGASSAA